MLFVVRFHDDPAQASVRKTYFEAHIRWLREHQDRVLIGGSLREDPDALPVGGLWIVDCMDKSEVETLLSSDPFWINGLRTGVEILSWNRAFPDPVTI